MGHIAHMRKQFKSINTYGYIVTLIKRRYSPSLSLWELNESPSPKNALCQVWLKLPQWFWRRRCLNFINVFSLFHIYLPWKYGEALNLNKLESTSPKDALCQVWLKFAQWFWRRRCFNFVNVFSLFRNYLPLGKGGALHLNKLESPSPFQWFWRRKFLNFVNFFSLFLYYLLMEKGGPFIWTNLNPLHPRMLCAKFGWNWPSGFEEDENVRSFRRRWRRRQWRQQLTTDKFWLEKFIWAFGSGELKRKSANRYAN